MRDLIKRDINIYWDSTTYLSNNIEVFDHTFLLQSNYICGRLPTEGVIYLNQRMKTTKFGPGASPYTIVYRGDYYVVTKKSKDIVYLVPQHLYNKSVK